jgi:hypothetical protein
VRGFRWLRIGYDYPKSSLCTGEHSLTPSLVAEHLMHRLHIYKQSPDTLSVHLWLITVDSRSTFHYC